jgi:glycosidase
VNKDFARYANWGDYFGKSRSENPAYQTRKPTEEEYNIQKLFAVFQMCYLGAPMIYYGDEAGMWGANDPDCRKPMVWSDLTYTDEIFKADGSKYAQPQSVFVRKQTFEHYQKLIQIRNSEKALQLGTLDWAIVLDDKEIIGFKRSFQGEEVLVLVNNSTSDQLLPLSLAGNWRDLYANVPVNLKKKLPISAKGFYILKKQR